MPVYRRLRRPPPRLLRRVDHIRRRRLRPMTPLGIRRRR